MNLDVEHRRLADPYNPRILTKTIDGEDDRFVERLSFDGHTVPDSARIGETDDARADGHGPLS